MKKLIYAFLIFELLLMLSLGVCFAEDPFNIVSQGSNHYHFIMDCGICNNYSKIKELEQRIEKLEEKDEEKPFICNNCGIGGGHLSTCPIWD